MTTTVTVKSALTAALRGRRRDVHAPDSASPPSNQIDPSTVQIFAHELIAELFGAGLRVQNLRGRVSDEHDPELEQIADQIDRAIRELREFAFTGKVRSGTDESTSGRPDW